MKMFEKFDNLKLKYLFLIALYLISISCSKINQNIMIVNIQSSCKFCLKKSSINTNNYSFTECPTTYDKSYRFNFYGTEDKYIFTLETNDNNQIYVDNKFKFFLFPIFSDERLIISIAHYQENFCLTNNLNNNSLFPFENSFDQFFTPCDYSGSNEEQIFIREVFEEPYFVKIKFYAYMMTNQFHPNSNSLMTQEDIDTINDDYPDYRIYFNSDVEYKIINNIFDGYLIPNQRFQNFGSNWNNLTVSNRCKYPIHLKDPISKEFPFFNYNRCQLDFSYSFYIDKLNRIVFKVKNITRNLYTTTYLISNNSNVVFNLSQPTNYPPSIIYLNNSEINEFEKFLEFGNYNMSITLTYPSYFEFMGLNFSVNDCQYHEYDIPIREKGAIILFKIQNSTTDAFENTSLFTLNSKIRFLNNDNPIVPIESEYLVSLPYVSEFSMFVSSGKNKISLSLSDNNNYSYTTQYITVVDKVDSNFVIIIRKKPVFDYTFQMNLINQTTGISLQLFNFGNYYHYHHGGLYFRPINGYGLSYKLYNGFNSFSGSLIETGSKVDFPQEAVNVEYLSYVFEGIFHSFYGGEWGFVTCSDDKFQLYLNDYLIINRIEFSSDPTCQGGTRILENNVFYEIKILYSASALPNYYSFGTKAPYEGGFSYTCDNKYYNKIISYAILPSFNLTNEATIVAWVITEMETGTIMNFYSTENSFFRLDKLKNKLRVTTHNNSGLFEYTTSLEIINGYWNFITFYILSSSIRVCVHNQSCLNYPQRPKNVVHTINWLGYQNTNNNYPLIFAIKYFKVYDVKISDTTRNADENQ